MTRVEKPSADRGRHLPPGVHRPCDRSPAMSSRRLARAVGAVAVAALLVGGCAASARQADPASSVSDQPKPTAGIKRCSPSDPDRYAWFCIVGQLLYNIAGGRELSVGYASQ